MVRMMKAVDMKRMEPLRSWLLGGYLRARTRLYFVSNVGTMNWRTKDVLKGGEPKEEPNLGQVKNVSREKNSF